MFEILRGDQFAGFVLQFVGAKTSGQMNINEAKQNKREKNMIVYV